jgi:predicted DNA-binding transcriptional regulator AlpA
VDLLVEILPALAGVAEAAAIMGWDKRRVITYIDRGRFPEPLQTLASGRVWRRSDVEAYAAAWHARRAARAGPGAAVRAGRRSTPRRRGSLRAGRRSTPRDR